jgi:hypothetical protein
MKEAESAEQLRLFQQAIVLAGDAVETLKRDQRAALDALRLDVEVLSMPGPPRASRTVGGHAGHPDTRRRS